MAATKYQPATIKIRNWDATACKPRWDDVPGYQAADSPFGVQRDGKSYKLIHLKTGLQMGRGYTSRARAFAVLDALEKTPHYEHWKSFDGDWAALGNLQPNIAAAIAQEARDVLSLDYTYEPVKHAKV